MKKLVSVALSAAIALSLCACGDKEPKNSKTMFEGVEVQEGCYYDENGVTHVDTEKLDYTAGLNITWSFDEETSTLIFEGEGRLTDVKNFKPYMNFATNAVIGEGITEIDASAFEGFSMLEGVALPSSLLVVGDYSFRNCNNLKSVELPENVNMIGREAFAGCVLLGSVSIPKNDSLFELRNGVFKDCSSLIMAIVPPTITYIAPDVFENCETLALYGVEESFAYDYAMTEGIFFQTYVF